MKKIFIGTANEGKLREIKHSLKDIYSFEHLTKENKFDVPETGTTFVENALIKARTYAKFSGLPTIAEDAGLCVPTLNNAPGLYSARYAGEKATSIDNINKLLEELIKYPNIEDRRAFFYCLMVYLERPDSPKPIIAEGIFNGYIALKPGGSDGFGYDPVFFVPEHNCTAAQLSLEQKNEISHRAKALEELNKKLCQI